MVSEGLALKIGVGVVHATLSIYYYTRVAWRYSRCPTAPRVLKESWGERGFFLVALSATA